MVFDTKCLPPPQKKKKNSQTNTQKPTNIKPTWFSYQRLHQPSASKTQPCETPPSGAVDLGRGKIRWLFPGEWSKKILSPGFQNRSKDVSTYHPCLFYFFPDHTMCFGSIGISFTIHNIQNTYYVCICMYTVCLHLKVWFLEHINIV